jgi:signal transduction histidine kinase
MTQNINNIFVMDQNQPDKAEQLRDFFFTIIESLPGGILLADRHGSLLAANREAVALLDLVGSSIQHRSCWDLLAYKLKIPADELVMLHFPGGKLGCEVPDAGGKEGKRYFLIKRNELKSPFLHVSGFFLSLDDITFPAILGVQRSRQNRFSAMQEMAIAMVQELRNPLGSLELYASLLNREVAGAPDTERLIIQMHAALSSMNHLLDNFVTFSGMPAPARQEVELDVLLHRVLEKVKDLGDEHGVSIAWHGDHRHRGIIGDPELLLQLLVNLAINAIESMGSGGSLRITTGTIARTADHPEFIEIKFLDQGEGIPPENLEKIFDPFFSTRNRKKGLGLAIAHHITEAHHGYIRVESEIGRGSLFTVLLPVGPELAELAAKENG